MTLDIMRHAGLYFVVRTLVILEELEMKIEMKHVIAAMILVGLTTLFKDELAKGLRRSGWL